MKVSNSLLYLKTGFKLKIKIHDDMQSLNLFQHELLLPFYDMSLIKHGQGANFEKVFSQTENLLPLIVLVDVFYLPYRKEFMKYHASHAIFCADFNQSKEEVFIIDWYDEYNYKNTIKMDDYVKARSSLNPKDHNPFSGFQINNYWYKIDKFNLCDPWENIEKNIIEALDNSKNDNGIYTGVYAWEKILDYIRNYSTEDTFRKLHDELYPFYRASLLSCIYYAKADELYGDRINNLSINYFYEYSKHLENLNYYLIRASMIASSKYIIKIENIIQEIIRLCSNSENILLLL